MHSKVVSSHILYNCSSILVCILFLELFWVRAFGYLHPADDGSLKCLILSSQQGQFVQMIALCTHNFGILPEIVLPSMLDTPALK